MKKRISIALILIFGFISCKTSENDIDQLEIAKQYYQFCTNHYIKVFFDWRDSITKLQEEKMEDLADGYSYPFL